MPRQYMPRVARTCLQCGTEFFAKASNVRIGKGKFCPGYCKYAWKTAHKKARKVANPNLATRFQKGTTPWNKGKPGAMPTPWNKGRTGVQEAWNKGLKGVSGGWKRRPNSAAWSPGHPGVNTGRTRFVKGHKLGVGRKRPDMTGPKHFNWTGGKRPELTLIRESAEYKAWRMAVFTRDGFLCVECGSQKNLQADHIKPFRLYPDLRFDVTNGRTLCKPCHLRIGWSYFREANPRRKANHQR